MCRAVRCKTCGKTTWAGCGQHIAGVRAGVPSGQWCPGGHSKAEKAAATGSSRGGSSGGSSAVPEPKRLDGSRWPEDPDRRALRPWGTGDGGAKVAACRPPSVPERATVRPRRSRWLALLVLLVVITVGGTITAVVLSRDDAPEPGGEGAVAQLSQVQASCRDWMSDSPDEAVTEDQWCADMFSWMDEQSDGSMMGSTMWQGPEQMTRSCRAWVSQQEAADPQRCGDMVDWMDGHMASRGGSWMRHER